MAALQKANSHPTSGSNEPFFIADKVKTHSSDNPFIAFEFYPPRTEAGVENLKQRLKRMKKLNPLYIDFTWGAGGSTSDLTLDLALASQEDFGYTSNMHLTCTNMPKEKIDVAIDLCKQKGIKNILALRGDPPVGQEDWKPISNGFSCALDLLKYISHYINDHRKSSEDEDEKMFNLTVAGYPEGHPGRIKKVDENVMAGLAKMSESEKARCVELEDGIYVCSDQDFEEELKYLKAKVDAGADMIVTQMFYDPMVFVEFVKRCRNVGIDVPIIPGIMCVTNYGGFKRMGQLCKTRTPPEVRDLFEKCKDDANLMKHAAIELGVNMCRMLLQNGAIGLHFYTLNLDEVVVGILERLNLIDPELEYKFNKEV